MPAPQGVITLRDGSGSPGRLVCYLAPETEIEEARAALAALAGDLQAATSATVTGWSVTYTEYIAEGRGGELARKEDYAIIVLSGGGQYAVVSVPCVPLGSFESAGAPEPPPALLLAIVNRLASAPFCNPFGALTPVFEAAFGEFRP